MNYNDLQELIDVWVTETIESLKADPIDLSLRNAVLKGAFEGILITMTNEERQKIADRMGLNKKQEVVLTQFDGEDSI